MGYNVLFLCTGNSPRSIFAEAILKHRGAPELRAFSAGSRPAVRVNPYALRQIAEAGLTVENLRSKNWDEYAAPGAPRMDFIFTVCDNAANEVCPVWPGQPVTAHWSVTDPAAVHGSPEEIARAFRDAFVTLEGRIGLFLSLPLGSVDALALRRKVAEISDA